VLAGLVSVSVVLWMLPVVLGLALAIPLALLTGRRSQPGLLRTPEDLAPPPVVNRAMELRGEWEANALPSVAHLLGDSVLLYAHMAMLPPPRRPRVDPIDPILLQARTKLEEAATLSEGLAVLSTAELVAVLNDVTMINRLTGLRDC